MKWNGLNGILEEEINKFNMISVLDFSF